MNSFGRNNKNTSSTTPSSIQLTSGMQAVVSTTPSRTPPSTALRHASTKSHQTSDIELAPAVATGRNKADQDTMQELSDFQIDSDDDDSGDGFDDVEFGDMLVTNATAHTEREQRTKRKNATVWVISGLAVVGICVGIIAAVVVNVSSPSSSTSALTTSTTTVEQSLDLVSPTLAPMVVIGNDALSNVTDLLNETLSLNTTYLNMTDIIENP